MISAESREVAKRGKDLYEVQFEQEHPEEYVCIEPQSGEHFLGSTFDEAVTLKMC